MLIRSHELVNEGYSFLHGDTALTVFSASNYCGKSMNKAAYVVLKADLKPHCTNFMVDESKFQSVTEQLQKDVIDRVSGLIFAERYELAKRFTIYDKAETGTLSRVKWAKAMTKVLGVSIPWLSLQPLICTANLDGSISYIPFLERYRVNTDAVDSTAEEAMLAKVAAKFLAFGPTLEHVFKEMDTDGNGKISYKEFVEALNSLNVGISKQGLYDLMRTLDKNADNAVTFSEFQSRFEVHFNHEKKKDHQDEWVYKKLRQIGTKLYELSASNSGQAGTRLAEQFKEFDLNQDGCIDSEEFKIFLEQKLNLRPSQSKLARLLKVIDENGDGRIDIEEFTKAFAVFDSGDTNWQGEVLQRLYSTLLKNKTQLRKAFKLFDVNGDGKINAEEFRIGIEALNDTLAPGQDHITPLQSRELFAALRNPTDDSIDYDHFLESFSVEVSEQQMPPEPEPEPAPVDTPTRPKRKPERQLSSIATYSASVRAEEKGNK